MKIYNLATSNYPFEEMKGLGTTHKYGRDIKAIYNGEKRAPKKGEWYLSGAEIAAYRAPDDFNTVYHIAKLVRVEQKTVVVTKI